MDPDVISVDYDHFLSSHVVENVVYCPLKGSPCVGKAKMHPGKLKQVSRGTERCFMGILRVETDLPATQRLNLVMRINGTGLVDVRGHQAWVGDKHS